MADLITFSRLLIALARRLEKRVGKIEDEVQDVARVAAVLVRVARERVVPDRSPFVSESDIAAVHRAVRERIWTALQQAGVSDVRLQHAADGSAEVSLAGRKSFHLSPKLAHLLRVIVAPGGQVSPNGVPGWRSYAQVAAALTKLTGRRTRRRDVTQGIYRLRIAFIEASECRSTSSQAASARFDSPTNAPPPSETNQKLCSQHVAKRGDFNVFRRMAVETGTQWIQSGNDNLGRQWIVADRPQMGFVISRSAVRFRPSAFQKALRNQGFLRLHTLRPETLRQCAGSESISMSKRLGAHRRGKARSYSCGSRPSADRLPRERNALWCLPAP